MFMVHVKPKLIILICFFVIYKSYSLRVILVMLSFNNKSYKINKALKNLKLQYTLRERQISKHCFRPKNVKEGKYAFNRTNFVLLTYNNT